MRRSRTARWYRSRRLRLRWVERPVWALENASAHVPSRRKAWSLPTTGSRALCTQRPGRCRWLRGGYSGEARAFLSDGEVRSGEVSAKAVSPAAAVRARTCWNHPACFRGDVNTGFSGCPLITAAVGMPGGHASSRSRSSRFPKPRVGRNYTPSCAPGPAQAVLTSARSHGRALNPRDSVPLDASSRELNSEHTGRVAAIRLSSATCPGQASVAENCSPWSRWGTWVRAQT